MAIADLPSYVERVGVYRDMNAAVLRFTPGQLAEHLVSELVRANAARVADGRLYAA